MSAFFQAHTLATGKVLPREVLVDIAKAMKPVLDSKEFLNFLYRTWTV